MSDQMNLSSSCMLNCKIKLEYYQLQFDSSSKLFVIIEIHNTFFTSHTWLISQIKLQMNTHFIGTNVLSQILFANKDYSQVSFPNMPQGCYQVTMFLQVLFSSRQQC